MQARARLTTDNALAECNNGAVAKKLMGYRYRPQKPATAINRFDRDILHPYRNFERHCNFAVDSINDKGRVKNSQPRDQMTTLWEQL